MARGVESLQHVFFCQLIYLFASLSIYLFICLFADLILNFSKLKISDLLSPFFYHLVEKVFD